MKRTLATFVSVCVLTLGLATAAIASVSSSAEPAAQSAVASDLASAEVQQVGTPAAQAPTAAALPSTTTTVETGWLVIFAALAGLGAASVLAVRRALARR